MPAQEEIQSQSTTQPTGARQLRGGQHVSGDIWGTAFKETKADRLARFLGWFSIGLGATELLFPKALSKAIGTPRHPTLTRFMGVREIVAGLGILKTPQTVQWMKARIGGDAMDLGMLLRSYGSEGSGPIRLTGATAMVAGVTALDIVCANELGKRPVARMDRDVRPGTVRAEASFAINKSPHDCYAFWRDPENIPKFMKYIDEVRTTGERTSHWTMKLPAGRTLEWDSEITSDTPNEEISWRSMPGSALETTGSARFEHRLSGPGAIVRVAIQYTPPGASMLAIATPLMETISEFQLREDLRHLKNLMESGEIPTTEGQPSCRKGASK